MALNILYVSLHTDYLVLHFQDQFFVTCQNEIKLFWYGTAPIELKLHLLVLGMNLLKKNGCKFKDCVIYHNVYSLPLQDEYDVIIVHVHTLWQTHLPNLATKMQLQHSGDLAIKLQTNKKKYE